MLVELSQCDYEPVQLPIMWALSNLLLSVENQNIFEGITGRKKWEEEKKKQKEKRKQITN